jgi:hypothetical protein
MKFIQFNDEECTHIEDAMLPTEKCVQRKIISIEGE